MRLLLTLALGVVLAAPAEAAPFRIGERPTDPKTQFEALKLRLTDTPGGWTVTDGDDYDYDAVAFARTVGDASAVRRLQSALDGRTRRIAGLRVGSVVAGVGAGVAGVAGGVGFGVGRSDLPERPSARDFEDEEGVTDWPAFQAADNDHWNAHNAKMAPATASLGIGIGLAAGLSVAAGVLAKRAEEKATGDPRVEVRELWSRARAQELVDGFNETLRAELFAPPEPAEDIEQPVEAAPEDTEPEEDVRPGGVEGGTPTPESAD